ncbi:MAG: peptide deformylase [Arcobacter sp.]|uniref:peptide deformylase n=1 Tax=Arcobacter sp. TaxID=1872629 RepID=UPI003B0052E2
MSCHIAKLGEDVLRLEAKKVEDIKSQKTQTIIKEMLRCLKKSSGVGLAAPQIFHSCQILIISSHPNERYPHAPYMEDEIIINPIIIETSKQKEKGWEGCLSIPGIRAQVPRHTKIKVKYTNINNEEKIEVFEDFIARVFQHEYDHLKGLVYLDRVEDMKDIITEEIYFKTID